jgi:hypothetical protein
MRKLEAAWIVLVLGGLALAGCGGDDGDGGRSTASAPQVGKAKLVRAPAGSPSAIAASIPVTYGNARAAQASHRVRVSGKVIVKDQGGDRHEYALQPGPDSDQVGPQPGSPVLHAHQFMAPKDAAAVSAAVKGGDDVSVESRADVDTNTGGSPAPDSHSTSESTTSISALVPAAAAVKAERAAAAESTSGPVPGDVHGGADPCDSWDPNGTACDNEPGSEWTTDHFWASHTEKIDCPSGFGPVTYLNVLGVPFVEWGVAAGTSKFTSVAVGVQDNGSITITNDNTDGHHHSFTPVLLCCQPTNNPQLCNGEEGGSAEKQPPASTERQRTTASPQSGTTTSAAPPTPTGSTTTAAQTTTAQTTTAP